MQYKSIDWFLHYEKIVFEWVKQVNNEEVQPTFLVFSSWTAS